MTARVTRTFSPIGGVTLIYRIMFGAETSIPMVAKTPEQRQLLRFGIAAPNQFGKIYVVPQGTPADRAAALESAFTKTFTDKEFLAEADKGRLEIDPVSPQQAHELITEMIGMSPAVKAQLQKMLRAQK